MFAPVSFTKKTLKSREKTLSEGGSAVCEIALLLERPETSKGLLKEFFLILLIEESKVLSQVFV